MECCSIQNPCGVAEGHCDNDDECLGHNLCGTDNCVTTFPFGTNCCYDPIPGRDIFSC